MNSLLVPDTCAIVTTDITTSHHLPIVLSPYSLVEEVFDVLGDKQNVAFDDLAKLHQLGLVTLPFNCMFPLEKYKQSARAMKGRRNQQPLM